MRILVTGASGFLGSYVMKALAELTNEGVEVVPWTRNQTGNLQRSDDRKRALERIQPEYVVHLAWATTGRENYELGTEHRDWSVITSTFARECIEQGARVAVAGSAADIPGDVSYASAYSEGKRATRVALQTEIDAGTVVWLRPQYLVSIAERRPRVVREYMTHARSGTFHPRNPEAVFDFVEVRDVAEAIALTILHGMDGVIDLGSGTLHSVQSLVAGIAHQLGYLSDGRCTQRQHTQGMDMTRLIDLGWRPRRTGELFHGSGASM